MRKRMGRLLAVGMLTLIFAFLVSSAPAFAVKPSPSNTKTNGRQTYPPPESPPSCKKNGPKASSCPTRLNATLPGNQSAIPLGVVLGLGLAIVIVTPTLVSRRRARARS
jgi:hypothetical protein